MHIPGEPSNRAYLCDLTLTVKSRKVLALALVNKQYFLVPQGLIARLLTKCWGPRTQNIINGVKCRLGCT